MRVAMTIAAVLMLTAPAQAAETEIRMSGSAYHPDDVAAKVGDVLKFHNDDAVAHNVFVANRGFAVDLGKQEPGATAELTLGKPGRFEVECAIHPHMRVVVEITP